MNNVEVRRQRLLIALLIASWTLNVALGVAYFARNRYPIGAFFPGSITESRFDRPGAGDPFIGGRRQFRQDIAPFIEQRQGLILALTTEFAKDSLDTARIHALSDSLDEIMSGIKGKALERLIQMHGVMPLETRREALPRMMRHFGMDREGRPPCIPPCDSSVDFPRREFKERHKEKRHGNF